MKVFVSYHFSGALTVQLRGVLFKIIHSGFFQRKVYQYTRDLRLLWLGIRNRRKPGEDIINPLM